MMDFGICFHPGDVAGWPALPADFLEGNVQGFLQPEADEAAFAPKLAEARAGRKPLRAFNCFLPGGLKCVGPEVDQARLDRYGRATIRRAAAVGARLVVFGSGGARRIPDGFSDARAFEQFAAYLRFLGPLAAEAGVTFAVETLNRRECNFLTRLDDVVEVVRAAGGPGLGVLADSYHMGLEGDGPESLIRHGAWLRHVHLAEVDGRGPPGRKGEDFRPFFRALADAGYTGGAALECQWRDVATELEPTLALLRAQWVEASGQR